MEWSNKDPRDPINKIATFNIVILRPSLTGVWEAGLGTVEVEHGYCVLTTFENHSIVGENDDWDPIWLWIRAPNK